MPLTVIRRSPASVLGPLLYLRRSPGRTLPMAFVVALSIVLVACVTDIVHSIDLTVFTLYGYNRYLTGLTPRNALQIDPAQTALIKAAPDFGILCPAHGYQTLVKTIFGKMPLPIFGIDAAARALVLQRCHVVLSSGRMPVDGKPEAVISADVARNLGLRIGDVISNPESEDSFAPVSIRLVGLLKGNVWLGLTSKALADRYSPFSITGFLAFSKQSTVAAQRRLDAEIDRVVDKGRVRVWKYEGLVREERSALANLYLILDVVIGIIVFSISFVCGLLSNIYFTQRLPEIATLHAIGFAQNRLLRRAVGETILLCCVGWLAGTVGSITALYIIRDLLLTPKGLILNPLDLSALVFTIPLPAAIVIFAVVTISYRLKTLDPVSIIERRG